jgi:hypothetical protein
MSRFASAAIVVPSSVEDAPSYRVLGLLVVSLFPALFWVTVLAGAGTALGHAPSSTVLAVTGSVIALFCGAIAGLLARAQS